MRVNRHGAFNAGDLIKITVAGENAESGFFRGGHKARLMYYDTDLHRWRANFNNKGNAAVTASGMFWVGDDADGDPRLMASKFVLVEHRPLPEGNGA